MPDEQGLAINEFIKLAGNVDDILGEIYMNRAIALALYQQGQLKEASAASMRTAKLIEIRRKISGKSTDELEAILAEILAQDKETKQ
jgi:hypothetical protein